MIVRAECSIDIDDKRKIWVELSAEGDNPETIVPNLASAAVAAALEGYSRRIVRAAEGGRESTPPNDRPTPIREKKPDLRGMGEISDEEADAIVRNNT